jgi:hypothetical protein
VRFLLISYSPPGINPRPGLVDPDRFELPKPKGACCTSQVGLPAPLKAQKVVSTIGFEPIQALSQQFYRLPHALQLGRVPI